jgi:hypothetical protein
MIELTIKRPNGEIEKVQREGGMTKVMFEKMQEATRNAGRGEVLSWELVDTRTDEEKTALAKQDRIESIKHQIRKAHDRNDAITVSKLGKELEAIK